MNPVPLTCLLCCSWFVAACGGRVDSTLAAFASIGGETHVLVATGGIAAMTNAGGAAGSISVSSDAGPTADAGQPVTPACARPSWILADSIPNARDLGAIPLPGAARVACNKVFRGPKLSALTERGCQEFDALGFRTVIDLRIGSESQAYPEAACVSKQAEIIEAPLPIPYSVSPTDYLAVLHTTSSIALALDTLADDTAYPVYFHCTYGRDRTGVLSAVVLLLLGASRDDIMADYMLSDAAGVGAYPGSLSAVLDEIESVGGIETYLSSVGVSAKTMQAIRRQLTTFA